MTYGGGLFGGHPFTNSKFDKVKKVIALISFSILIVASAFSQSTSPRYGTTPNSDNTGRVLTYNYKAYTDPAGTDTIKVLPVAYSNTYRVTLTDSTRIEIRSAASSYADDIITVIASGASGSSVNFIGNNFISAGRAALSSGGRAIVSFRFDGAKWVESCRVTQ